MSASTKNKATSFKLQQGFVELAVYTIKRAPVANLQLLENDINDAFEAMLETYFDETELKAFSFKQVAQPSFKFTNSVNQTSYRLLSQPFENMANKIIKMSPDETRQEMVIDIENALRNAFLPIFTDEELKAFHVKSFTNHEDF